MMTDKVAANIELEDGCRPQDAIPPPPYTPLPVEQKVDKPLPPLPQGDHMDGEETRPLVPPKDKVSEDVLDILRQYDTAIIIDDSASMREENRWVLARTAVIQLCEVAAKYDQDGIDLHFLNNYSVDGTNLTSIDSIEGHFKAVGNLSNGSFLGMKLDELLVAYWHPLHNARRKGGKIKPVNFIILTDGHIGMDPITNESRQRAYFVVAFLPPVPVDDDLGAVIIRWAKELDKGFYPMHQIGIQIVQVGMDKSASDELERLDRDVRKHFPLRDMLDITQYRKQDQPEGINIINKILTGAINPRMQMARAIGPDLNEDTTPYPSA
ncbi:hypothetical protein QCA50_000913 [Cerrena zonata]|uniref:VWFA domain-containing protein n=1 Tax=Cerrena zonata TaxID=2478898 RepID=A0AAW0GY52_9APHY